MFLSIRKWIGEYFMSWVGSAKEKLSGRAESETQKGARSFIYIHIYIYTFFFIF